MTKPKKSEKGKGKKRKKHDVSVVSSSSSHAGMKIQKFKEHDMKAAIKMYKKGGGTLKECAAKFHVPRSTLGHRVKARAHLGSKAKTLGGYRVSRVLNKGKQARS